MWDVYFVGLVDSLFVEHSCICLDRDILYMTCVACDTFVYQFF
jgi:hypothetical protein